MCIRKDRYYLHVKDLWSCIGLSLESRLLFPWIVLLTVLWPQHWLCLRKYSQMIRQIRCSGLKKALVNLLLLLSGNVWNSKGQHSSLAVVNFAWKNRRHGLHPYLTSLCVPSKIDCHHHKIHDFFPPHYRTAGEDTGVTYPSVEDSQEVCTTSFSTSPPSQVGGNVFCGGGSYLVHIWALWNGVKI